MKRRRSVIDGEDEDDEAEVGGTDVTTSK